MVKSENQTSISRRRNENFKTTYKEGYKQGKYGAGNVGTPEVNSVEDGSIGVHNIHDPKVLERVNAFVGSISGQEYLNPKGCVEQLASKLRTLGLEMKVPEMSGNGSVNLEVSQFGGRFGKDIDGSDIK